MSSTTIGEGIGATGDVDVAREGFTIAMDN